MHLRVAKCDAPTPVLGLVRARADRDHRAGRRAERLIGRLPTSSSRRCGPCWPSIVTSAIPLEGKSPKGGLRLDSAGRHAQRGRHGPRGGAGRLEASLLLKAVKYDDDVLKMPPKGKLPAASIATLAQWVKEGAVVPHDVEPVRAKKPPGLDFEAARSHWAYQPIRRPSIPAVDRTSWPRSPVDSFVLAALEKAGLDPSPAGRPPHLDPPRLLRPDRLAADRGGGRGL